MTSDENSATDLGIEGSNPNASGAEGLRGGMGVSSERTGPQSGGTRSANEGVQGTGTVGSATTRTEGTMSTERSHPQEPAEGTTEVGAPGADTPTVSGPEMDDTQQEATQSWADTQPAAGESDDSKT